MTMTINRNLEYIAFKCDKNHHWNGTFVPNTPPEVGTLVGSWNCPICGEIGIISYIECPDTLDKEPKTLWLVPINKQVLKNELGNSPSYKLLLDSARQIIADILRYKFGAMSTQRIFDNYPTLTNVQRMTPYDKEALTKVWKLQDILDIIEEMIDD